MSSINKLKKALRSIDGQSRILICDYYNQKYEYFNGIGLTLLQHDYIKFETVRIIITVPKHILPVDISFESEIFAEDYLLRQVLPQLHLLNEEYQNNSVSRWLSYAGRICLSQGMHPDMAAASGFLEKES